MERVDDKFKDRTGERAVDESSTEGKEIHVLLIEDNPGDARLVKETLKEAKGTVFNLIWVNRLHSGLKVIAKGEIDVILSDLFLPDSRGLETIRVIKTHAPNTPIIAMTGYADEDGSQAVVQAGAKDYIVKHGYHFKGVSRNDGNAEAGEGDMYIDDSDDNHLLIDAILRAIGEERPPKVKISNGQNNKTEAAIRKELATRHTGIRVQENSSGTPAAITELLKDYHQPLDAVKTGSVSEAQVKEMEKMWHSANDSTGGAA